MRTAILNRGAMLFVLAHTALAVVIASAAMWLLDAAGTPLAVGTIYSTGSELTVATFEQGLVGFTIFAVTVEDRPVEAPTSDPVMAGQLGV